MPPCRPWPPRLANLREGGRSPGEGREEDATERERKLGKEVAEELEMKKQGGQTVAMEN